MSFGADGPAAFRHGAKFVQAIDLTIPEGFLLRADTLIE
jgi:hypothetical protein